MAKYRNQLRSRYLVALPIVLLMLLLIFLPEIGQYIIAHEKKIEVVAMVQDGLPFLDLQYRLSIFRAPPHTHHFIPWSIRALATSGFSQHHFQFNHHSCGDTCLCIYPAAACQTSWNIRAEDYATHCDVCHDMPSFSIYLQKVVPIREPRPGEVVFTGLENLQAFPNAEVLFNKGGVVLVKLPKMKGSS